MLLQIILYKSSFNSLLINHEIANIFLMYLHQTSWQILTRARSERVTPLGRLNSVYNGDIEYRFLRRNGQMTLKVKVNDLHFQYQLREYQDAYLVHIWCF